MRSTHTTRRGGVSRWSTACLAAALLMPLASTTSWAAPDDGPGSMLKLDDVDAPGLIEVARIRRDHENVPHIFALNEHDAVFMLGWVHAQDRFFQMDSLRRNFSGTAAELFGAAALPQDIQLRTLGLRRAAEASWAAASPATQAWVQAYVDGVNAYLAQAALPPEYAAIEVSRVAPWTPVDSMVVAKGLAFGLSFDLGDLDRTEALLTFQATGAALGFDGTALFSEDLYRTAPFDLAISIPDGASASLFDKVAESSILPLAGKRPDYLGNGTLRLIRDFKTRAVAAPLIQDALKRPDSPKGSNWWVFSGTLTETGAPMIANDPHLALDTPSTFYEAHLRVRTNGDPPMNVYGVSFPGTPGIVLGCNPWLCWGATVHPMDVTDVYQEAIAVDPMTGVPAATLFEGTPEPLVLVPQVFQVNQIGDGMADNLADAGIGPLDGGLTLIVPRRNNGPIVSVDVSDPLNVSGLSVQYTGWGATFEVDALRGFARARTIEAFRQALQSFDVGSQNWSVAEINGDIAYFTSAEMPIREDLQDLMQPDGGIPPYFVRDGTHGLRHEWKAVSNAQPNQALDFEILPFAEMPQDVNPARGYVLNCNNDPVGTSLDNNPLNQVRADGGLYYLSPGYASGFRQGRLQRLVDEALAGGGTVSKADLEAWQANNQLLDAEVLVPFIENALFNASLPGKPAALATLAADPAVAEAVARLGTWDFATPTGLTAGFDPGDDPTNLPAPMPFEIDASVAATLYGVWRGQMIQSVIDGPLAALGLGDLAPGSALSMTALRNILDTFPSQQGVGASGVPFIAVPGLEPDDARDATILTAMRDGLDLLAGDAFAAAFDGSTNQGDYRWGYLHRIVFDHPLGGPFNLPGAGGLMDLDADNGLLGVARAGGFGALDASAHGARADGVNEFMFGSGPARRFVGEMSAEGVVAEQVIPGGESGVLGNPFQIDQLLLWLTNQYHAVHLFPQDVIDNSMSFQRFVPPSP